MKIGPFELIVLDECPPDRLYVISQLHREPWETRDQWMARLAKHSAVIRIDPEKKNADTAEDA